MIVQTRYVATRYGQRDLAIESLRLDASMNITGHPGPIGQIVLGPQNPKPVETFYSKFWKAARQFLTPQRSPENEDNDAVNMPPCIAESSGQDGRRT